MSSRPARRPSVQVVFHYADGEQVTVTIRPSDGVDALYAPRRYLLDRLLVDAAAAAGAEVIHASYGDGAHSRRRRPGHRGAGPHS